MSGYSVINRNSMADGQPEDITVIRANFDAIAAVLSNLTQNPGASSDLAVINVKHAYGGPGAVGDGSNDDTAAIQRAFDVAFTTGGIAFFPPGVYLCGVINWRYVSVVGSGRGYGGTVIKGKPGQDIIHVTPTDLNFSYPGFHFRDLKFILDDSVNAVASFPNRDGVGNAVFAGDFPDGAGLQVAPYQGEFVNLWLESSSQTPLGRNNTAGMYWQCGPIQCLFSNVRIMRFRFGYREDSPRTNLGLTELAPDHNRYESIFFDYNERQMRLVNEDSTSMDNIVMHGVTPLSGLELVGIQTQIREECANFAVSRLYIEQHEGQPWLITGSRHHFIEALVMQTNVAVGAPAPGEIACKYSKFEGCAFGAKGSVQIKVTGHHNKIEFWPVYDPDESSWAATSLVDDQGYANQISVIGSPSGGGPRRRGLEATSLGYRILHQRDSISGLLGHVDPPFVSGSDLIINPREWAPNYFGNTENGSSNGDYSRVMDSTSDFGQVLRIKDGQFNLQNDHANGTYGFVVGKFVPKGKVRMYIRAKAIGSGGSHGINIDQGIPGGTNIASFTAVWTTSYSTQFVDLDLSAVALGTGLSIYSGSLGRDLDISCVIFRPWAKDSLVDDGIFNVKRYGAVGDGVTDDSPKIQAAVTAMFTVIGAGLKGATLYFPPGVYRCNTMLSFVPTLDVTAPITIRGDGATLDIRTTATAGLRFSAANGKNWRHWSLRDLNMVSLGGTPTDIILIDDGPTGAALLYQFELDNIGIENCGTANGINLTGISVGLFEFQLRNCRVWSVPNTKTGIWFHGGSSGNSSCELYYCNVRGGLNNVNIDASRIQIVGGTFLLARNEAIKTKSQGGNILHPHVELPWQSDVAQVTGHAAIYVEGWANCIGVESFIDGGFAKHVFAFYCYSGVTNVIGTSTIPSGGRNVAHVLNVGAAGGQVNFLGVPAAAVSSAAALGQPYVLFLGTRSAANPDTTGLTLANLEIEVNQLKAALRANGTIDP